MSKRDIKAERRKLGLRQGEFWSVVGVTQSGGSRYENGRNMPEPTEILLGLLLEKSSTRAAEKLVKLRARIRGKVVE